MLISSRQNRLVKRFIKARERRDRTAVYLEGWRLVKEALLQNFKLEHMLCQANPAATPGLRSCLDMAQARGVMSHTVTSQLMRELSELESPPGIIALIRRPDAKMEDLLSSSSAKPLLVAAAGVRDPGNLGVILRAADAFGVSGLITLEGTVDAYSPKVVRASAGSVLRIPIVTSETFRRVKLWAKKGGLRLVATAPRAGSAPDQVDLTENCLILAGGEAEGLPGLVLQDCDTLVTIPQRGVVESLNVAVAISVLLYEAARQRQFKL